jgi:MFS family permease
VPHREDTADGTLARKRDVPSLLLLSLILLCVGCFFASVQAGVTSIAIAAGTEGSAGIIYGVMGLTSATAGLLTPVLPARFRLPARLTTFLCLLLLFVIPLVTIGAAGSLSLVALGFAVALAGVAVAPSLITAFSLGERTVPPAQVSWAMTMLSSGIVLGYAIAALTAGILAQQHGAIGAFCVTFGAVAVAVVLSVLGRRRFTALMARETSPGKLVST